MPEQFFTFTQPISESELIQQAKQVLANRIRNTPIFENPHLVRDYLILEFADKEIEVFYVLFLTAQHQLIKMEAMSFGTIDEAVVYPREILKAVTVHNAQAIIMAHNHPGGRTDPSQGDIRITKQLRELLQLIDVRVLDHFIVANDQITSFAEKGLL